MKIRDIIFWILILAALVVAIWLFIGSPTIETGLLMITIFIASSEILLWRTLFEIDKRTAISFEKVKLGFEKINNKLDSIERLIKTK